MYIIINNIKKLKSIICCFLIYILGSSQSFSNQKVFYATPTMNSSNNSFSSLPETATDNKVTETYEQSADQVDDQYDEQSAEQVDVDYTVGADELSTIALCAGYLAKWNAEDDSGNSMAKDYNNTRVGDAGPRLASWALLAAMDDLRVRSASDPTLVPVLCAVARTPFPRMARVGLRTDPLPLTEEVHRVFVKRELFNPRVNLTTPERETPLGQSSVWTLVKLVNAQWRAGVNQCFRSGLRDLPIIPAPREVKGAKKVSAFDDERRGRPTSRVPEDSAWNNLASPDLVGALHEIKDAFNNMLYADADLGQAYKEQGRLRREQRDAAYAKRQLEYEARRQEKAKNPPTDHKPQGKSQGQTKSQTKGQAQSKTQSQSQGQARTQPKTQPKSQSRVQVKPHADSDTGFNAPVERVKVQRAPKPKHVPQIDSDGFEVVGRKTHSKDQGKHANA